MIPYNPAQPAFNTKELNEEEKRELQHFSMPHIIYIGSNEGCGCSFRHALYDKGKWSNVVWEEEVNSIATQADHQALVDYLRAAKLDRFEIYACWDGDHNLSIEFEQKISIKELLHSDFFFKERGHYFISL